ncbi:hypothetical protein EGH21_16325 [Halomicroarcula sp. F13]|uniref:DUF1427 family protein n=1 Tax=Haloarcula rubra TaxID=2487747 RepID=A0AAW4PTI5_9EURY|nr:hypothetical protein [Halomicroarcula rubra]MBX0324596.1 hypothetical protein [Halomicroarcula rubra]
MQSVSLVGAALTVAGILGYALGVTTPYPGRSFSMTALMLGLTVLAVGRSNRPEGDS